MTTYDQAKAEYEAKQRELDEAKKRLDQAAKERNKDVVAEILEKMKEFAITFEDLGGLSPKKSKKSKGNRSDAGLAAKGVYYNPKNPSETWHGRGPKASRPQWVKDIGDEYKNYKVADKDTTLVKQAATPDTPQAALGL